MNDENTPKSTSRLLPVLALLAAAAVAMLAGLWFGQSGDQGPRLVNVGPGAVVMPETRKLRDFELIGDDGKAFTKANIRGKWQFVFFGYTYCPDVCPIALNTFRDVKIMLGEKGQLDDVGFLFVSVDPQRDTPERLAIYVDYFDPDFVGATGSEHELQLLTRQMGVVYRRVDGKTEDDYLVDHSAGVFLLNPDTDFQAYFPAPHDPVKVVEAFGKIRELGE